MEPFKEITAPIVPLPYDNIDTDQIIPARYMKSTQKKGLGKYLFYDWRFDANGNPKKDFVLNQPDITCKILVAGDNFGSGSSREHAPWALQDYGFRVIIASSFADIFKHNALNVGLLPVEVDGDFMDKLLKQNEKNPNSEIHVDLVNQKVEMVGTGDSTNFEINKYKKKCLLHGIDDIDYLMNLTEEITEFENKRKKTKT
ncbi:MAG: 3-isopropylmalate dehydratase small subunit [Bacteroidales bacterium]|nr:3-isopropylmalate dehydratase small subunit [Bacteroidales bacterium]MBS3775010.1 3-isopropylmalate dehydratase small subunit [Bacteroidales bacterium]